MQPIGIAERVKATYKSYIKTAFPIIDDDLEKPGGSGQGKIMK
jgi:hypothetical protein